jgi:hypothetical protein
MYDELIAVMPHLKVGANMKFSRYDRPYEEHDQWNALCRAGTWRVASPKELEGLLPQSLLNKANSILLLASASKDATAYVANINRVDFPASAIDQEPYILAFDHSASTANGGFIHHGDWTGRTHEPGKQFFDAVSASGIQAHYPLQEMPPSGSGQLDDLKVSSHKAAFWEGLVALGLNRSEST